jgi:hypothetical protein
MDRLLGIYKLTVVFPHAASHVSAGHNRGILIPVFFFARLSAEECFYYAGILTIVAQITKTRLLGPKESEIWQFKSTGDEGREARRIFGIFLFYNTENL